MKEGQIGELYGFVSPVSDSLSKAQRAPYNEGKFRTGDEQPVYFSRQRRRINGLTVQIQQDDVLIIFYLFTQSGSFDVQHGFLIVPDRLILYFDDAELVISADLFLIVIYNSLEVSVFDLTDTKYLNHG